MVGELDWVVFEVVMGGIFDDDLIVCVLDCIWCENCFGSDYVLFDEVVDFGVFFVNGVVVVDDGVGCE